MPADVGTISADGILSLAYAFRGSKALLAAVELEVFTVLGDATLPASTLAERTGVAERGATDFFDALVALGMLERDTKGGYSNTVQSAHFLNRTRPTYIGGLLDHLNHREYEMWAALSSTLRSGRPHSGIDGPHFEKLYTNTSRREAFARAMTGGSLVPAQAIAQQFPWKDYETFVDIGTAEGCLPVQLAKVHPHLTGGGFDLAALAPSFESYVTEHKLSDRLQFYPGNFLIESLPSAGVIIFGRVLHNWDLGTKKMLLNKAIEALPSGGAVIVYERFIDDDRRVHATGLLSSLHMRLATAGGFDFTAAECIGWMREGGFRSTRVEPLTAGHSMAVGIK